MTNASQERSQLNNAFADSNDTAVPTQLRQAAVVGTAGFAVSILLLGTAFLTNSEPLPYFPWLELPVQFSVDQPRLYRYPLSMTVSLWIWHITAPFVFLLAYVREQSISRWLIGAPVAYLTTFFVYCYQFWPNAGNTWMLEPATSWPCYLYCYHGTTLWATVTVGTIGIGVAAWLAAVRSATYRGWITVGFGLASLPLGIPVLYAGYLQIQNEQ